MRKLIGFCVVLVLFGLPLIASAQYELIQEVPDQIDDAFGIQGQTVVIAGNGDLLVFITKLGEITDDSSFPFVGEPARLFMHRSADEGRTWAPPVEVDAGIDDFGSQGLGVPRAVVMPSGAILLTYFYLDDVAPNFSASFRALISTDHGASWTRLNDKPTESATLTASPGGQVVSLDWVDDGQGNLSFHTSTYDADSDTWTDQGFVIEFDPICSITLHVTSDTNWEFYYASCAFGFGGTSQIFRGETTDGGASWSDPVEVFTADSGFGSTLGTIVDTEMGLTAVYSGGGIVSYRNSSDGGNSWSEAVDWTFGPQESINGDTGDIAPICVSSIDGPLCVFLANRDATNKVVHIGAPFVSGDPLLGATAGFSINQGVTGAWFDPATAGQGFLIDVEPESQFLFIAWFTFEEASSKIGSADQRWMTAQGTYRRGSAELPVFVTSDGAFADPQAVNTRQVGTLQVEFTDCSNGVIEFNLSEDGLEGTIPITRVIPGTEGLCSGTTKTTPRGVSPRISKGSGQAVDQTLFGAWFDPATPGQGFLFDIEPTSQFFFMAWFTYESNPGKVGASEHRWYTAQGNYQGSSLSVPVSNTSGGAFNNPQATSTVEAGSVTIDFTDCSNATLSYDLTDDGLQGEVPITRVIPGTEALCEG